MSATRTSATEVVMLWQGVPMRAELIPSDQRVTLGPDEGATFMVPPELVDVQTVVLEPGPLGATITVPERARLLTTTGVETDTRVVLAGGHRYELVLGAFSFVMRHVDDVVLGAVPRGTFDLRAHRWTLASVAVHAAIVGTMWFLPPRAGAINIDLSHEQLRYIQTRLDAVERVEPEPELLDGPSGESAATNEGRPMAGEEGVSGAETETRNTGGRVRVQGDAADSRVPLTAADARNASVLGALASLGEVLSPIASPFSVENARGGDLTNAWGSLLATNDGFSQGTGGFGMRGPGRGGCPAGQVCAATGTVGVGDLDTIGTTGGCSREDFERFERELGRAAAVQRCSGSGRVPSGLTASNTRSSRVPTVRALQAETFGGLGPDVIRRTIRSHLSEVRFCYEQALLSSPELEGRVSVRFMIAPSGAVTSTAVAPDSNLPSQRVSSCVVDAVRRWAFPQSEGMTQVTYPFAFAPAAP